MNDQTGSGDPRQSGSKDEVPPDVYEARISGSPETFAKLRQQFELDMGCRGAQIDRNPDGTSTLLAYASEAEIRELRSAGYKVDQGDNVSELGRQRQKEVGQGDRFEGGRVAPRGLGEKPGYGRKGGSAS